MQSTVEPQGDGDRQGRWHVAVIMDGNGRWATRRGLPRSAGHRAGVKAVRRVVEAAPDLGIAALTLFAFSSDNWQRPDPEVRALMGLLRHYLRADLRELVENGVRLSVIGRRDRLPEGLSEEIAQVEQASAHGQRLNLQIAIDYSSRDAIAAAAARWLAARAPSREAFGRLLAAPRWRGQPRWRSQPRCRSPHPLGRREKTVGLPAVGSRLRRALLRRYPVAGFRRRGFARRDGGFPSSRAALWRGLQRRAAHRRRMTQSPSNIDPQWWRP